MVEYLVGIHDFKGRSSDELDISKGDYIEVIEDDAEFGDSWYIGRNCSTNKTGLFPKVFTANAPTTEPQSDITATLSDIDQALYDIAAHSAPNPESVMYWTPYDVRTFFVSRQYSEPVAERFVQHQITGAILLELDSNLLKELDIPSFGTRFEISKEIEELRQFRKLESPVMGSSHYTGSQGSHGSTTSHGSGKAFTPQVPFSLQSPAQLQTQPQPQSESPDTFGSETPNYLHSRQHSRQHSRGLSGNGTNGTNGVNGSSDLPTPQLSKSLASPWNGGEKAGAPNGKGHHRRHSSVSSILSGTGTPKSPPAAVPNRLGRSDSKPETPRFKGASQYLKPALIKQKTSAFVEGIRDTTAEESAKTADHSGWMQKRGGMGVGSWKARFFTLHGTRLSYFTTFKDTKERGLIDITGHKALPFGADDKLVSLHAASFGAGKYGFKVVPPGPGYKKGVSFTAPRVHHFAVDSEQEMHQWLQALMKATIERDDTVAATSSCTTPVVSLPKAREIVAERLARYQDASDFEGGDEEEQDPLRLFEKESLLDPFPQ